MRRGLELWFTAFVIACGRTPSTTSTQTGSKATTPSAAPTSSAPPAREAVDAGPVDLPDGCYSGADAARDAGVRGKLFALAEACAEGMEALLPGAVRVDVETGGHRNVPFTVTDPSRCIRALAVSAEGLDDLGLEVVNREDVVLGKDELQAPFAVVNRDGPICMKEPGRYRAVVRASAGAGQAAVQVYQAK